MPNYKQDPSDYKKQVPSGLPANAYDRSSTPSQCTMSKTPNYVVINTSNENIGFFFGSSASFASKTGAGPLENKTFLATSSYYKNFGKAAVGTRFDIHPIAWSGSKTDDVTFVYKSGLATGD